MRQVILAILLLVIQGCSLISAYAWRCGDGACPRYEVCPVENKKVEVATIRNTKPVLTKCGWFKNFNCLKWTDTLKDEKGHVWKMPGEEHLTKEEARSYEDR